MSKKNFQSYYHSKQIERNRSYLGRMTDEEYEALWNGEEVTHHRAKSMRRLTDEEYKNLPYGNEQFHKQFKK